MNADQQQISLDLRSSAFIRGFNIDV